MSEAKVKFRVGAIKMEAQGEAEYVYRETEAFSDFLKHKIGEDLLAAQRRREAMAGKTVKVADAPSSQDVEHDVVAIYDNAGIPSFMHRFRKTTNKELFGGSDKVHSAFVIGGEEYDEIYISVYENCNINGKPYSLPYQKPWTSITNDEAAKACASKGDGWHLATRPEWGLLANICRKTGVFPHGNTNYGKYHANEDEKGVSYDGCRILTGSGPASWTHNHKVTGVHDLCGNVWEEVRGFRIRNGVLQRAKDNDGAMDIDLSEESKNWVDVLDDDGKPVKVSVKDGEIIFTTAETISTDYNGCSWKDVRIDCKSEQLKELGLYPGEPDAYCYIDSTDGEYLPICGGLWDSAACAGDFGVSLYLARSSSGGNFGFRSAYYRKRKTEN